MTTADKGDEFAGFIAAVQSLDRRVETQSGIIAQMPELMELVRGLQRTVMDLNLAMAGRFSTAGSPSKQRRPETDVVVTKVVAATSRYRGVAWDRWRELDCN